MGSGAVPSGVTATSTSQQCPCDLILFVVYAALLKHIRSQCLLQHARDVYQTGATARSASQGELCHPNLSMLHAVLLKHTCLHSQLQHAWKAVASGASKA